MKRNNLILLGGLLALLLVGVSIATITNVVQAKDIYLPLTSGGNEQAIETGQEEVAEDAAVTSRTLNPGDVHTVRCTGSRFDAVQVDAVTVRLTCIASATATPIPATTTPTAPTATPTHDMAEMVGQWHAPGAHDGMKVHEHGDAPQAWVTTWSNQEFGHGVQYGGDENSGPMEHSMKHEAYKGITAVSDAGGQVYLRYHAASNPLDRSARYHSYEVYYRDVSGNVSFWQGWYDTGDPATTARCPRRSPTLPCENNRPIILVVDQTAWNAGIRGEQWYMFGSPQSGVSWDMGLTILNATTLYKPGEITNAADQSTWTATGDLGLQRRSDGFWYRGRGGGGTALVGWFCAEPLGRVTNAGSKTCAAGSLPQYIAPTLAADARSDGFGNFRIGWLIQKSFNGNGVMMPN